MVLVWREPRSPEVREDVVEDDVGQDVVAERDEGARQCERLALEVVGEAVAVGDGHDGGGHEDGPGDEDGAEDLGEVVHEVEERLQHGVEGVGPGQVTVVEERQKDELGVRQCLLHLRCLTLTHYDL